MIGLTLSKPSTKLPKLLLKSHQSLTDQTSNIFTASDSELLVPLYFWQALNIQPADPTLSSFLYGACHFSAVAAAYLRNRLKTQRLRIFSGVSGQSDKDLRFIYMLLGNIRGCKATGCILYLNKNMLMFSLFVKPSELQR
ncbi:hypothetical protein EK904_007375 [Melospiza melodia maxima]|nr:hypothetical protein EK904_007375 [Melospiza melodia maxima]